MPLPKKPGATKPGAQSSKSGLMAKLGNKIKTAHAAHKDDETVVKGGGDLPPGVNGIAQLVEVKFDKYKTGEFTGEYYFYAAGICVIPKKDKDGVPTAGLRTNIMEPMCETPNKTRKTFDEHYAWVLNELRKLGVETNELSSDDLESTITMLKESAPFFTFRTWAGKPTKQFPNPQTFHQWGGSCDAPEGYDGGDAVVEESADEEAAEATEEEEVEEEKSAPKKTVVKGKVVTKPKKEEVEEEPGDTEESVDDLDALAEQADGGDEDAQKALQAAATEAGIEEDAIAAVETWAELVGMINESTQGDGGGEEEAAEEEAAEEETADPAKEEVHGYCPLDPKTKKPVKKPVECEVIKVDKKLKTVDLKNLDNPKTIYKGVKWDKLVPMA